MGEEQLQKIYEAMTSDSGVVVKFTSDSQLTPLKAVLMDVFNKGNKGLQNTNDNIKKELSKKAKEDAKALSGVKKAVEKVESAVESSKGGMFSFLKSGNFWLKAGQMMLGAASMLIDYGKQYYSNLKKLSDAGVRISEGFDRAFGAYAAVANMSQENFAKLLIQNKRFVTRMNSVANNTMSGSRLIAEMSSRINGRFSLDEEQTGTILEFFGEITNSMSRRKLTDNYLTNQAEKLAETMNGLSKAVGMSIEQFKEKVKMDEQDLAERRIMRDPRARGRYMLNTATMGKDVALYLETGNPNEKVLNMMGNPVNLEFFQKMFQANQKTNSLDKKQLLNYARIYNSNMRLYIDTVRENFDKQQAAFLGLSGEWGQGQYGSMNFLDISAEMMAKAMDESDLENKTVNGLNMLNRTVDLIKDLLIYKVMKDSGKSVAEGFKYATMGADSLKKFLLGKDADKIDDSMKAAQFGVDITKAERFYKKAQKNDDRKDMETIADYLVSSSATYLKASLQKNESLDTYNEYAARNGLLHAIEENGKIKLVDKKWYDEYNQTKRELDAWKEFGKSKKTNRFGAPYYYDSLSGKKYYQNDYDYRLKNLQKQYDKLENVKFQSMITKISEGENIDKLLNDISEINKERKLIIEFGDESREIMEGIREGTTNTATNTGEQAEQAKEANEQMKSENADNNRGKYHGVTGAVPIGAM